MARVTTPTTNTRITSAWGSNLRNDYVSQSDTTSQDIESDLDFGTGKRPKFPFAYFNPTTTPAATEGHVYYDSVAQKLKMYDGTQWRDIPATAGGGGTYKLVPSYTIYKDGSTYYAMDVDGDIDYSGAAFHTVLNNVINALTSGGLIFVKQGTYTVTGEIQDQSQDDIELCGEGMGRTILQLTASTVYPGRIISLIGGAGTEIDNWHIHDLTLDGNSANQGAEGHISFWGQYVDNLVVERVEIKGTATGGGVDRGKCVDFYDCDNAWFIRCRTIMNVVAGSGKNNFAFTRCINMNVLHHYAENGSGGIAFFDVSYDNTVANGHWENQLLGGLVVYGPGYNNVFVGNTIVGNGVNTQGGYFSNDAELATPSHNNVFANNVIRNCPTGFVIGLEGYQNIVANNNFNDLTDGAIIKGCFNLVSNNIFYSCSTKAIAVEGAAGNVADYNLFEGNHIYDCLIGGQLTDFCDNNRFEGNQLVGITSLGFKVMVGDRTVIVNNELSGAADYINIAGGVTNTIVRHNDWDGATIASLTDGGTDTVFDAITVNSIFDDSDAGGQSALSNIGDHMSIGVTDDGATDTTVRFNFILPSDFHAAVSANLYVVSLCTGGTVMRWNVTSDFGTKDEAYNVHSDSVASTDTTMAANALEAIDIAGALTGSAAGDRVGVAFIAEASHANYTLGAVLHILNFQLNYI